MPKEETNTIKFSKDDLREILAEVIPKEGICNPELVKEHTAVINALPGWMEKVDKALESSDKKLDHLAIAMAKNRDEYMERSSANTQEIRVLQAQRSTSRANVSLALVGIGVLITALGLLYQIYNSSNQINKIEREIARSRVMSSSCITNPMHSEPLWKNKHEKD